MLNIVGYFSCEAMVLGDVLSIALTPPKVGIEGMPPGPLKSKGASSHKVLGLVLATGCC